MRRACGIQGGGSLGGKRQNRFELAAPALQPLERPVVPLADAGEASDALGAALTRAAQPPALLVQGGKRLRVLLLALCVDRTQLLELALDDRECLRGVPCFLARLLHRLLRTDRRLRDVRVSIPQARKLLRATPDAQIDGPDRLVQGRLTLGDAHHRLARVADRREGALDALADRTLGSTGLSAQAFLDADRLLRLVRRAERARQSRLELADLAREAGPADGGERELGLAQLLLQSTEFLGTLRLAAQRSELALDLAHHVLDARQVLHRALELALAGDLPAAEESRSRRLLDEQTQLLGLRVDDLRHAALLDHRVGLRAHAAAEEQLRHVAQAGRRVVDEVVRLARAEDLPLHRELGHASDVRREAVLLAGDGERGVGLLEGEDDLGEVQRRALRVADEDDVLHLLGAEVLDALLAQGPADRIGDVRLAAAVRAHDGVQPLGEAQPRVVAERFEAEQLDLPDAHTHLLVTAPRAPVPRARGLSHQLVVRVKAHH